MATRSWNFETFMDGVTAPATFNKDGLDDIAWRLSLIHELTGKERTAAEDALIARLREGDARGAWVLAEAGCARAAPALVELARSPAAFASRDAADALARLGHDQDGARMGRDDDSTSVT